MTFKGGQLKRLAATQQVEDVKLLARRGTITDRNGAPLAVSEDAATVFATPYLVKKPVGTADRARAAGRQAPRQAAESLADRSMGFVYLARKISRHRRANGAQAEAARRRRPRRHAPGLPAEDARGPGARRSRRRQQGPARHRAGPRRRAARLRRRAAHHARRARATRCPSTRSPTTAPAGPPADDRRDDPGPRRAGARGGGAGLQPQGRDGDRDGPQQRRHPRDGQLAAGRRQRVGEAPAWARINRAVGFTYEPGSTFKSITVAGALEAGARAAAHASSRSGRRSRWPTATITEAHGTGGMFSVSRHPRPLVERRRGQDRPAPGRAALRLVGATGSASARPTDLPLPGESQGIVPAQGLLGLLDREPADRPGPGRHADADDARLLRDRERRQADQAAARAGRQPRDEGER